MKASSLLQVLAAAHLSYNIEDVPDAFSQRGGIMLVGPPENLKTTLAQCLSKYNNAMVVGDVNVKQLVKIRDQISQGRWRSMVFPAYEKIYKRDADTASNVEGHILAMTEEGMGHASFEDHDTFVRLAKCFVVGACVEEWYRRNAARWLRDGFTRRFLWCHFILDDPDIIRRAIFEWDPLTLGGKDDLPGIPIDRIKMNVTPAERKRISQLLEGQEGKSTPFVLCNKILTMLKWRYRENHKPEVRAMEVFEDFAQSLSKRGARLKIER